MERSREDALQEEARIRTYLLLAGFEEGVVTRDETQAKPGFVADLIAPPVGRWHVRVWRWDWPEADHRHWIAQYAKVLEREGIKCEIEQPFVSRHPLTAEIIVYLDEVVPTITTSGHWTYSANVVELEDQGDPGDNSSPVD